MKAKIAAGTECSGSCCLSDCVHIISKFLIFLLSMYWFLMVVITTQLRIRLLPSLDRQSFYREGNKKYLALLNSMSLMPTAWLHLGISLTSENVNLDLAKFP